MPRAALPSGTYEGGLCSFVLGGFPGGDLAAILLPVRDKGGGLYLALLLGSAVR